LVPHYIFIGKKILKTINILNIGPKITKNIKSNQINNGITKYTKIVVIVFCISPTIKASKIREVEKCKQNHFKQNLLSPFLSIKYISTK